jgi:16S rRNA (cytosine967-C5)-methyltransferase
LTTPAPARELAARVLERVWVDGAFAAASLDAEIGRLPRLDPRDAALATELVYGVLRTQAALEARVDAHAKRRGWAQDPLVRAHVLMGVYALAFLDRVPTFAAVSEAVLGVSARDAKVSGFVNALLRKIADEPRKGSLEDAIAASAPGWLRGALRRAIGRAGAASYLAAGPVPPPLGLAVADASTREAWRERIAAATPNATVELGVVSPHALLLRGAGDARRLPGAFEAWIPQEEGAQVVALAVGARPGERVLDACAGRGNKAWLIAEAVGPAGAVDAADLHAHKLDEARALGAGARVRATYATDWTRGPGDVPEGYDRVLIDAPCSGVGTLRRRPEIAEKRSPEDVARLAELQATIGRAAATRAKVGGAVVFAVCSVLTEECEDVVARLLEPSPGLVLEPAALSGPAAALSGAGASLRLLPHVHGTDGYFVACFKRAR